MHPAWKICLGLVIVLFLAIGTGSLALLAQQDNINDMAKVVTDIKESQEQGRERSYILRAIAGCMDIINDQQIEITSECVDKNIVVYFPPSICKKLPIVVPECGDKAVVIENNK